MKRTRARGFTLIELVVVVAIVGVLAAAAMPLQELALQRVRESALREALRTIRGAIDAHRDAVLARRIVPGPEGTPYPPSLAALVRGVPVLGPDGQPGEGRLYFLRRLPRDPFADPALAAADTWAVRASTTPPEAPGPGADVFDVASRSPRKALDGTLLQDW